MTWRDTFKEKGLEWLIVVGLFGGVGYAAVNTHTLKTLEKERQDARILWEAERNEEIARQGRQILGIKKLLLSALVELGPSNFDFSELLSDATLPTDLRAELAAMPDVAPPDLRSLSDGFEEWSRAHWLIAPEDREAMEVESGDVREAVDF